MGEPVTLSTSRLYLCTRTSHDIVTSYNPAIDRLSGTVIATNLDGIGDFNLKTKQIAGYN